MKDAIKGKQILKLVLPAFMAIQANNVAASDAGQWYSKFTRYSNIGTEQNWMANTLMNVASLKQLLCPANAVAMAGRTRTKIYILFNPNTGNFTRAKKDPVLVWRSRNSDERTRRFYFGNNYENYLLNSGVRDYKSHDSIELFTATPMELDINCFNQKGEVIKKLTLKDRTYFGAHISYRLRLSLLSGAVEMAKPRVNDLYQILRQYGIKEKQIPFSRDKSKIDFVEPEINIDFASWGNINRDDINQSSIATSFTISYGPKEHIVKELKKLQSLYSDMIAYLRAKKKYEKETYDNRQMYGENSKAYKEALRNYKEMSRKYKAAYEAWKRQNDLANILIKTDSKSHLTKSSMEYKASVSDIVKSLNGVHELFDIRLKVEPKVQTLHFLMDRVPIPKPRPKNLKRSSLETQKTEREIVSAEPEAVGVTTDTK